MCGREVVWVCKLLQVTLTRNVAPTVTHVNLGPGETMGSHGINGVAFPGFGAGEYVAGTFLLWRVR